MFKKYTLLSLSLVLLAVPSLSFAATSAEVQAQINAIKEQIQVLQQQLINLSQTELQPVSRPTQVPSVCPVFTHTLSRGINDAASEGEVTKLQQILAVDPTVYPEGLITGYYGVATERAVQRWQAKQGIVSSGSPVTTGYGVVGSQTRARIITACHTPPSEIIGSITVLSPNGGETWSKETKQTIKWQDNMTTTCQIGLPCPSRLYDIRIAADYCEPSIYTCTPRHDSYQIANGVSSSSYSWEVGKYGLGYDIPYHGDYYTIQVCQSGTSICDSSDREFKIVGWAGPNIYPVINGFPAVPADIKVGQIVSFSWAATDADGDDLAWDISWGDGPGAVGPCSIPHQQNKQNWNFTRSHAWAASGTYTVKATANDCRGGSAEHTLSVPVGSSVVAPPSITALKPVSGMVGTNVTITGSNFTSTNNSVAFGAGYLHGLSSNGTTITFTLPSDLNTCPPDRMCILSLLRWQVVPGSHPVSVINSGGMSNSFMFTVSAPPLVTILSPNGGEVWEKDTHRAIDLFSSPSDIMTYGDITLTNWIQPCDTKTQMCPMMPSILYTLEPVKKIPLGKSSFLWKVGYDMNGSPIPAGQYVVVFTDSKTGKSDQSDAPFSIVEGASGGGSGGSVQATTQQYAVALESMKAVLDQMQVILKDMAR
ncbi:MAG: IPT/TIG domain-containing protein [bacterium]|nr:IPT/TIG domain-containing protein [bacterium]